MNDQCRDVSYDKNKDRWVYTTCVNGVTHVKEFKTKINAIRYKYHYESSQSIVEKDSRS